MSDEVRGVIAIWLVALVVTAATLFLAGTALAGGFQSDSGDTESVSPARAVPEIWRQPFDADDVVCYVTYVGGIDCERVP